MVNIKQEADSNNNEIQEPVVCIGPLNFNRQTKKVSTVRGVPLYLDEKEFDALYMLAAREGETLAFDLINATVWDAMDSPDNREAARLVLSSLSVKVKDAGANFMWIEHKPESGYMFKMRWRRNGTTKQNGSS